MSFLGRAVTNWSAREIRELGVGLIPEDRQKEGLLPGRPVAENFVLGLQRYPEFSRAGVLNSGNIAASATCAIKEYDVRPVELDIPAGNFPVAISKS